MTRFLSFVLVSAACLAPAAAEANPYAAYVAKYLGEYMLGKALDEAWNAATGAPDVKELDMRLRCFEGALSQVDARLRDRIGELRRRIDQRPTREEVRQIVLGVLNDLEKRITDLERRADRVDQKIAQFEEVFGIVTTVPPAPLIRSSVEAGNPAVHPLTAEWARLLCECETSRLKIHKLQQTLADDHPELIKAQQADQNILKRITACHAKVLEESVKRIDDPADPIPLPEPSRSDGAGRPWSRSRGCPRHLDSCAAHVTHTPSGKGTPPRATWLHRPGERTTGTRTAWFPPIHSCEG